MGQFGGAVDGVAAAEGRLYVGFGPRLAIFDLADPGQPTQLGQSEVLPGVVECVTVSGSLAYVCTRGGGNWVLDVSDPAGPTIVGQLNTPGSVNQVLVLGDFAYLADPENGLWVFDVSDPGSPREVWSYDPSEAYLSGVSGLAVSGSTLFVGGPNAGLELMDVSDPARPVLVGAASYNDIDIGYQPDLEVSGDYVYVAEDASGLSVVDVSDPSRPSVVAESEAVWGDLEIEGRLAFGVGPDGDLAVLSLADPARPEAIASAIVRGRLRQDAEVVLAAGHAYLATGETGLRVVEVTDLSEPAEVGSIPTWSFSAFYGFQNVFFAGDRIYLVDHLSDELVIVDAADPANPREIGRYGDGAPLGDLYVLDSTVYLGTEDSFLILDVTDPADITRIGPEDPNPEELMFALEEPFESILAVSGSQMWVTQWDGSVRVFDVGDPAHPRELAAFTPPENSQFEDLFLSDGHAFVALHDELQILDISALPQLQPVGRYSAPPADFQGSVVSQGLAYVMAWDSLKVVDVSDPANPEEVSVLDAQGTVTDVFVTGSVAYLTTEDQSSLAMEPGGFWVFDFSDPTAPSLLAGYDPPDSAGAVYVAGSRIYLVAGEAGIVVLQAEWQEAEP